VVVLRRQTGYWLGAAVAGVMSGWLGTDVLGFLSWGIALVWLVVTVSLGQLPGSKNSKALRLATYGFVTGFVFMCFGNVGEGPAAGRVVPFAIVGLLGAVSAVATGLVTHVVLARSNR
jgi:hypothetical protein